MFSRMEITKRRIFALEGEWNSKPSDRASVIDVLSYLEKVNGFDYFHRRTATKEEFFHHLGRAGFKKYDIAYLTFHGSKNKIYTLGNSKDEGIDLNELLDYRDFFAGKIVHFGSCETLRLDEEELIEFKRELGVKSISGYTKSVDWMNSGILDLAYFNLWGGYQKRSKDLEKKLRRQYGGLCEDLGFIMV